MTSLRLTSRFLVVLLALCLSATAEATLIRTFVASYGNDANDCSRANPCRTLNVAIAQTSPRGEAVALDSGGYSPITIDRSITILVPSGLHAAVAPTSGDAVTITAPSGVVTLRGLYINSPGGTALNGIVVNSVGALHLENVVVSGFGQDGINFRPAGASELFVKDSIAKNNSRYGIVTEGLSGLVKASLDRVRLENNQVGLLTYGGAQVAIRDSVATAGDAGLAVWVVGAANPELAIFNCLITANFYGVYSFYANTASETTRGHITIADSAVTYNQLGIYTNFLVITRISNTTVTRNLTGLSTELLGPYAGQTISYGDNKIDGNGTDGWGAITATVPKH